MSVTIEQALDALSQAHGPVALAAAFRSLQGSVRRARQSTQAQLGPLAKTYVAAMAQWDAQKAAGVSQEDRLICLEKTLRAAWPQTREWKYLCQTCADHGLEMATCDGRSGRCGRSNPHLAHEFGTACWCAAGERFRAKPKPAEDFTAAGRSQLTRIGRRA